MYTLMHMKSYTHTFTHMQKYLYTLGMHTQVYIYSNNAYTLHTCPLSQLAHSEFMHTYECMYKHTGTFSKHVSSQVHTDKHSCVYSHSTLTTSFSHIPELTVEILESPYLSISCSYTTFYSLLGFWYYFLPL